MRRLDDLREYLRFRDWLHHQVHAISAEECDTDTALAFFSPAREGWRRQFQIDANLAEMDTFCSRSS